MDSINNLYAIGSQSRITFIDARTDAAIVHSIESLDEAFGVRSLAWNRNILTVGGGIGRISFFDLKMLSYLPVTDTKDAQSQFYKSAGQGWIDRSHPLTELFYGMRTSNAIYTLDYSPDYTRLFAAGGPLQLRLRGSYASVWQ
jgi:WD repeat-containing protein 40A